MGVGPERGVSWIGCRGAISFSFFFLFIQGISKGHMLGYMDGLETHGVIHTTLSFGSVTERSLFRRVNGAIICNVYSLAWRGGWTVSAGGRIGRVGGRE